MFLLSVIRRWLGLVFSSTTAMQGLAKLFGFVLAVAITFLVARGASLNLSVGVAVGGESKQINASGDLAYVAIATFTVFSVCLLIALGIACASTPALKIVGVLPLALGVDRQRIIVRNRSSKTMRFRARLDDIDYDIGHHTPAPLQITGTQAPFDEADIAGGKCANVDVFQFSQYGPRLLFASVVQYDPLGQPYCPPHQIPKREYTLRICVFPVAPSEGSLDTQSFRIIPKSDGRDELQMIPESATRRTIVAMAWFLGGLFPYFGSS